MLRTTLSLIAIAGSLIVCGQTPDYQEIKLNDLTAFRKAENNWRIVGKAIANLEKKDVLNTQDGVGVLVNLSESKKHSDLYTVMEHGDADIELEFMMATQSNSGIYLQGRYEVQLLDSWGKQSPTFGDCGGIYERWDDAKPEGQKGYEGSAPRTNACLAPGLWQKLKIRFQAPRFDAAGRKTANARILSVELNGQILHDNVELTGPTRGAWPNDEAAVGPIRFQGDHGSVAFRNLKIKSYGTEKPILSGLKYAAFVGEFKTPPDLQTLAPTQSGSADALTWEVFKSDEFYYLRLTGTLRVPIAGKYNFTLLTYGGGSLKVNGKDAAPDGWWERNGSVELPAGDVPFELVYRRQEDWMPRGLGVWVEGPGVRRVALHPLSAIPVGDPTRPILADVKANEPYVLRCFMDYKGAPKDRRINHAVQVGNPEGTHFTYSLDRGCIVQAWKGDFLDATPMWNDRGDGSCRPRGAVLPLGDYVAVYQPADQQKDWSDSLYVAEAGFRALGYDLNEKGQPTFGYKVYGLTVSDLSVPMPEGKGLHRMVSFSGTSKGEVFGLARGARIESVGKNLFMVDDTYYIRVLSGTATVTAGTLTIPATGKIEYNIEW